MTIARENQYTYQWIRAHQNWRFVEKATNNGRLEITDFLDEAGSLSKEAMRKGEKVMIATCDVLVKEKIAKLVQGYNEWTFKKILFEGGKKYPDRTLFVAKYQGGYAGNGAGMPASLAK